MTKNDSQSIALNTNWEHENLAYRMCVLLNPKPWPLSDMCLTQPRTLTLIGFVPYSTQNLDLYRICALLNLEP
jgi:hypothetical protein